MIVFISNIACHLFSWTILSWWYRHHFHFIFIVTVICETKCVNVLDFLGDSEWIWNWKLIKYLSDLTTYPRRLDYLHVLNDAVRKKVWNHFYSFSELLINGFSCFRIFICGKIETKSLSKHVQGWITLSIHFVPIFSLALFFNTSIVEINDADPFNYSYLCLLPNMTIWHRKQVFEFDQIMILIFILIVFAFTFDNQQMSDIFHVQFYVEKQVK